MPRAHPQLRAGPLVLTLPYDQDVGALLDFHKRNREHLEHWMPPVPEDFFTPGHWRRWVAGAQALYQHDQAVRLIMRHAEPRGGPIIGQINFTNIQRGALQACVVGYHIDHEWQGRGLMKLAMQAALRFMFEELRLHRIMANHLPHNERSAGLLKSLGFAVEGYAKHYLYMNGAWQDHVLTALVTPSPETPPGLTASGAPIS
jgi:[ribosomal protein S5]-alanine N-acetyltransferase